jgi:hypothetical protein
MFSKFNHLTNAVLYAMFGVLFTVYGVIALFMLHNVHNSIDFGMFFAGILLMGIAISYANKAWAVLTGSNDAGTNTAKS